MLQLTRRPDWRVRLDQHLAACATREFQAGEHDCALFAAGVVEALTGEDLAARWRGAYRTVRDGKALIGGDHISYAASLLPARESVLLARPGDIAIVGDALGVVAGENVLCLHPVRGLSIVPLTLANKVLAV